MSVITWINLAGLIVIPLFIVLGILKPLVTPKERMKKRILKNLNKLANKGYIILPEIELRDKIYKDHFWGHKPLFKKRFFNLFIESIRELSTSEDIIQVNRGSLFCIYGGGDNPFSAYNSCVSITPYNYSLREDNPDIYIGLKSNECQKYIESYQKAADATAQRELPYILASY